MTWVQRYRVRHYITNSIWILPLVSMAAALVAAPLLHRIDEAMGWESTVNLETCQGRAGDVGLVDVHVHRFRFLGLVDRRATRQRPALAADHRHRVQGPGHQVLLDGVRFHFHLLPRGPGPHQYYGAPAHRELAAYGCLASLGVFLFLIDHVGKALRPSGALRAVALLGREVIENVYPTLLADLPETATDATADLGAEPTRTISNLKDGVVLACDIQGLASLAQRADCVIEMVPQVGDFVALGDPLFRVFQGGETLTPNVLRQTVAIGQERTLEQDPAFAFRIMVDIASKGLSPAINDPTTAVLALDQIHHLLRNVGLRHLDDERVRDAAGRLRLIYRTPGWEDFVKLAVTEIRHFGGESIQIARRLRAMLENLIQTLPEERASDSAQGIEPAPPLGRTLLHGTRGSSIGRGQRLPRRGQQVRTRCVTC